MAELKSFALNGAKLVQKNHPLHNQKVYLEVVDGVISKIEKAQDKTTANTIDASGKILSAGLVDLLADFCDPGLEHREDIISGSKAALKGGYTHVAVNPYTNPVIDSKSKIGYIKGAQADLALNLIPLGTLSVKGENIDIPEIYDMAQNGARAFYSGKKQVNEKLLITALQYCDGITALPMVFPQIDSLAENGQINESISSSKTGLKPIPALAEHLAVANLINILEYAGGKLHISHVSSKISVDLIRQAKAKGLNLSASVAAHQLLFTDAENLDFDTRSKVNPPYRNEEDRKALIKGCADGTIDAIISDHSPIDIECKKIEFDHADFGIINLQTALPSLFQKLEKEMDLERILELMSSNPAKIIGLTDHEIATSTLANFTLLDPNANWTFTSASIASKSQNSPFIGEAFKLAISATCSQGKLFQF